ncbi:LysE family transporter [Candidatus Pelagibacter sp.]|nr:LysE family transporter [Candidatus Pelagibacter sp.]
MSLIFLGFLMGITLIFAIGPQNVFVIEQGLKKQYIFLVCLVCALSDLILIFLGIFLFNYFSYYFNNVVELILNILLIIFLSFYIYGKIKEIFKFRSLEFKNNDIAQSSFNIFIKTLGFTYLNPHVYSDTVFFLGNFSKSFNIENKIYFGIGASTASFLFFFSLGYLSKIFSNKLNNRSFWKYINIFIIIFMSGIVFYIIRDIIY